MHMSKNDKVNFSFFFVISEIATAKSLSPQSQEGSFQSLPQILLESDPKPEGPACDIKTRGNSLLFFSEHFKHFY